MFKLCREVRFNIVPGHAAVPAGHNSHAGLPAADAPALFWTVRATLSGQPDPVSAYLIDIKEVDDVVRQVGYPLLAGAAGRAGGLPRVVTQLFHALRPAWPGRRLDRVELIASPFQSSAVDAGEPPVTTFSQHFEFAAAHRLHNESLSEAENRRLFGKCNNPLGHGHNYEVKVTLAGTPDETGRLIRLDDFERVVEEQALKKVDHKFLNAEVAEFRTLNPSVENIAKVIFDWLKPHLSTGPGRLRSVTVWGKRRKRRASTAKPTDFRTAGILPAMTRIRVDHWSAWLQAAAGRMPAVR